MTADGHCPTCDRGLELPDRGDDDHDDERAPWHFKLLVAAVVVYLVWRCYQLFFS